MCWGTNCSPIRSFALPARQHGQVIEFFMKWYTRASALKPCPHGRVALVRAGWALIKPVLLTLLGTNGSRYSAMGSMVMVHSSSCAGSLSVRVMPALLSTFPAEHTRRE